MDKRIIFVLAILAACTNNANKQSIEQFIDSLPVDTTARTKNNDIRKEYYPDGSLFREIDVTTLDARIYTNDGKLFLLGRFNDTNCILNGKWEEWDRVENYKRFDMTFVNSVEEGPFISYRPDGKLYASGYKKDGAFNDTIKFYDKEGTVFEMQVWKADKKEKGGAKMVKKINLNDMRSDGTLETIKGKMYKWEDGERVEVDQGKK
jgi:antitoxin component YwqK of YwqJK toxin-antitoxin module